MVEIAVAWFVSGFLAPVGRFTRKARIRVCRSQEWPRSRRVATRRSQSARVVGPFGSVGAERAGVDGVGESASSRSGGRVGRAAFRSSRRASERLPSRSRSARQGPVTLSFRSRCPTERSSSTRRHLAGARDFRKDDSYRREDAVHLPEARDRVRRLALLLTPPVFVVAGEPDRFVAVVRAPRVFFAAVRLLGRLVPARDSDLEAERCPPLVVRVGDFLLAGLPAWGCEEPDGADRPGLCRDGVPLDPANRISRSSSRPAATAPSIMPARSTCLSARRPLATA